jgi:pimeloyl-ACP methyl ester carboxylesterase
MSQMSQTHKLLDCRGTRIHAVEQGEGPLVVLVHGFPESWYSWRHQIPALANAGYRVVAIDQRGYGRSSKYRVQKAYRIKELVGDIVGVIDATAKSRRSWSVTTGAPRWRGRSPGCTRTAAVASWASASRSPAAG